MLTTTHMLVAAAATTRPKMPGWMIGLGWLGGFFPDASVVVMAIVGKMTNMPNLWRQPNGLYWQEPWQTFSAISNSIPLWALLSLTGWLIWRRSINEDTTRFEDPIIAENALERRKRLFGQALMIFSVGALLHVLCDFPVHASDAHRHFWPFSDWRFHSPISYYQRDYYGSIVSCVEMVAGLALMVFLFRRFKSWSVRSMAIACCLPFFMSIGFLF